MNTVSKIVTTQWLPSMVTCAELFIAPKVSKLRIMTIQKMANFKFLQQSVYGSNACVFRSSFSNRQTRIYTCLELYLKSKSNNTFSPQRFAYY